MARVRAPLLACRLFSTQAVAALGADVCIEAGGSTMAQTLCGASVQKQLFLRATQAAGGGPCAAARPLTTSAVQQQAAAAGARPQPDQTGLQVEKDEFDQITDKHIPQRPMGAVEGASYTLVIVGGLAVAGAVLWAAANELLIQPKEYTCYNLALERIREDPRVTVRLGTPISAFGQDSRNRAARQRIPHRAYTDSDGVEHHHIQFHAKGPSNSAVVQCSMYQDSGKQWQYDLLFLDFGGPVRQRVFLEGQQHQ